MSKHMRIPYSFNDASISNVEDINTSFAKGRLKIMYTGNNRNKSNISRDAVERALPSLYNIPIVCHYTAEEGIGGHDIKVVANKSDIKLVNLTEPCGVVPEQAVLSFETETDDNGTEHEYLVADGVILWKRQECFDYIVNDLSGRVDHSMEITIKDGNQNKDTGYYDVKNFEFTALCLLERDEPCFEGSELELYSMNNFKQKMDEMMEELKETYSLIAESNNNDLDDVNKNFVEGGEQVLENENISTEEIVENIEENVVEPSVEIEEPEHCADEEAHEEQVAHEAEDESAEFALNEQVRCAIQDALSAETIQYEEDWVEPRYWMEDFDPELGMVYAWDSKDFVLCGFNYDMNGDIAVIDFESKQRMKIVFVPFEGESEPSPLFSIFSKLHTACEEHISKYREASDTILSMTEELNTLRQFKADAEDASAETAREELFAQFEDLVGIEAFETLKENAKDYSLEDLEEKCFAIRGRQGQKINFSHNTSKPKLPIERNFGKVEAEPYGGLVERFKNK